MRSPVLQVETQLLIKDSYFTYIEDILVHFDFKLEWRE
jgi:hypothetical protein